jgi:DNA-binding MarR family transcriptional regulator
MNETKTPAATPSADLNREILRLDNQLCFALYSASGRMTRAYRALLEPLGLTYPQYLVMMCLWEQAPRTVKAIGEAVGLETGTLTPLLKRLEAAGAITRRRDTEDERRVIVGLTPAGDILRDRATAVPRAIYAKLNTPFPDISSLTKALKGLSRNMAQIEPDTPSKT